MKLRWEQQGGQKGVEWPKRLGLGVGERDGHQWPVLTIKTVVLALPNAVTL